jgi:hypothetical protein
MANRLLTKLESSKAAALKLLRAFVRLEDDWSFDGIEVSPAGKKVGTVDIQLSHGNDLYGFWVVTLTLIHDDPLPVSFCRVQT